MGSLRRWTAPMQEDKMLRAPEQPPKGECKFPIRHHQERHGGGQQTAALLVIAGRVFQVRPQTGQAVLRLTVT